MGEIRCEACGTILNHVNEACPNCLPRLAERPPTLPQMQGPEPEHYEQCSGCVGLEQEVKDLQRQLAEAQEKIAQYGKGCEDCEVCIAGHAQHDELCGYIMDKLKSLDLMPEPSMGEYQHVDILVECIAVLKGALKRIEDMAERPRCVCGRPTGTDAIAACARKALEGSAE